MLTIRIPRPIKKPHEYRFLCPISTGGARTFGLTTETFAIPHDVLWDTVYPLIYMTRMGGPIYSLHKKATLIFQYPIVKAVAKMIIARCRQQGFELRIEAPGEILPGPTPFIWDNVVGFGGGKESSLMAGITRELGLKPQMMMGTKGAGPCAKRWDWDDITFFNPIGKGTCDRLIIQMMCGKTVYHGAELESNWEHTPWHYYYDIGVQECWDVWNKVFSYLGVDRRVLVPLQVLSCAQMPKVLCNRYPEIARVRKSVDRVNTLKNFHVALCEMTSGIDFRDHIPLAVFTAQAASFIPEAENYGFRMARYITYKGICSMLYHNRDNKLLSGLDIKDEWDYRFIHYGHYYRGTPPEFREILEQYVPDCGKRKLTNGVWLE